MAVVKRFEIYLLNLDSRVTREAKNTRPCVIVSPDEMNRYLESVIVAPITTMDREFPTRIPFNFLEKNRAIVLDQIRTVEKGRLVKRVGKLDHRASIAVLETLGELFAE